MPETLFVRDFSAGWCPSDDIVNGRPNALLQMDNLELDRNGALQLIRGTNKIRTGYPAIAHTMFSRFINNTRCDYCALADGSVYRNAIPIIGGGGDSLNAAFGTAFNYTLVCSGSKRVKDSGTAIYNLGVGLPTVAPTVTQNAANAPYAIIGNMQTPGSVPSGTMSVIGGNYDQCTTAPTGIFIMQSYNDTGAPHNCTVLSGVGGSGTSTDDDFIILTGYIANPYGVSLQFDVLLKAGDSAGDPVTDSYNYVVRDLSNQATFDTITGVFTIQMNRVDFTRTGGAALDWSTVYGFRLTVNLNRTPNPSTGEVFNVWGAYQGDALFRITGGTSAQFGTYQYAQVNVNNTGSYIAKSVLGPISNPITLNGVNALVSIQNPVGVDAQCNEAWIYRTGGNLGGTWYRVMVVKSPFTSPVYDGIGDQAALDLDITFNISMISIASITDKIYDIIGPIQGRWYYFTTNFMYPSDLNDPDLINPGIAIRTCGSASELYMWARAVSASVVIVGTSVDCYLLTGTFSTFPDGTIDIYYQSLGVKFPPITYDAVSYGGAVYYFAGDGWRMVLPTSFGTTYSSQNNQLLVSPNTDRLYRGEVCYGYQPPLFPDYPGHWRFPVTIVKNKLWCAVSGAFRGEVYDFLRQYWRTYTYGLGDVSACCSTQDNRILAFNINDKTLREYDYNDPSGAKLIDGSVQQNFSAMFTYKDNGKPRQRKDTYTFKTRCYTNGSFALNITDENGANKLITTAIHSTAADPTIPNEVFVDLSQPFGTTLPKSYLVKLSGNLKDVLIADWSIDYDARPVPLSFLRVYPTNFGVAAQKRLRTWPFIIDTLGNNVLFTPEVDGAAGPVNTVNTTFKKTVFYYFDTDVFGVDYGATFYDPTGLMEVWDTGVSGGGGGVGPDIVQTLPGPKQFDQVGPLEIFRWGKIVRMAVRVSSPGTPIPFRVYLGDVLFYSGQFNVAANAEDEYVVDLPKGVSGRILRVELGPCNFAFNRYYMKFQVAVSGGQEDTELRWITVPGGG